MTLIFANENFSTLRAQLTSPSGLQTASAITGIGDEAIMLSIGSDWRQLYVRRGNTDFQIVVSIPGAPSEMIESAEKELAVLVCQRI